MRFASSPAPDAGLVFLRLAFGGTLFLAHGWPDAVALVSGDSGFPDPLGIGPRWSLVLMTFAEFVCALLVMLGAATRLACLPIIGGLSVAVLVQHRGDPFADRELAVVYLAAFVAIAIAGGGRYAVDALWRRRGDGHAA